MIAQVGDPVRAANRGESNSVGQRLDAARSTGVEVHALGFARVGIGVAGLIACLITFPALHDIWEGGYLRPFIRLPLLPWEIVFATWLSSSIIFIFGGAPKVTGPLLSAITLYSILIDERLYGGHLLLLALLSFFVGMAGGGRITRTAFGTYTNSAGVNAFAFLARTQVCTVYFFTALSKINSSFLSGAVLTWSAGTPGALLSVPWEIVPEYIPTLLALAAITSELAIAVLLPSKRTFKYACLLGLGLHGSIMLFMAPRSAFFCFALLCLAIYPMFYFKTSPPLPLRSSR
ncbi:HTTM domain-containing protein [Nocardiopsis suaedae]|uniref:HTTM domain-containing protein n=1 Tax=Nocardiopsis suaedae TaxID=3018444 RepID=A0ABT4TSA1_9ACTN|nr:hypothetical protein [Nocardiopsis suaedae]MDA2807276.1 hypothetical protein [Nocardiopsis suaedae]